MFSPVFTQNIRMEEILQSTEIKWRFPIHQFRYMYDEIQTGFPGSAKKIKQKKVYIYYSSVNLMVMFYVSGPVSLGAKRNI